MFSSAVLTYPGCTVLTSIEVSYQSLDKCKRTEYYTVSIASMSEYRCTWYGETRGLRAPKCRGDALHSKCSRCAQQVLLLKVKFQVKSMGARWLTTKVHFNAILGLLKFHFHVPALLIKCPMTGALLAYWRVVRCFVRRRITSMVLLVVDIVE